MNKIYYEKPKRHQKPQSVEKDVQHNNTYQDFVDEEGDKEFTRQNSKEEKRSNVRNLIANIFLVVLSMALALNIFIAIGVILDMNDARVMEEDVFWHRIFNEEYADIVLDTWRNYAYEVEATGNIEQCYAVAEYFEAASLYKVAVELGNAEDEAKYARIMEEKLTYMHDILYIAEDINAKLGIE